MKYKMTQSSKYKRQENYTYMDKFRTKTLYCIPVQYNRAIWYPNNKGKYQILKILIYTNKTRVDE
jgi:hypothetical protein